MQASDLSSFYPHSRQHIHHSIHSSLLHLIPSTHCSVFLSSTLTKTASPTHCHLSIHTQDSTSLTQCHSSCIHTNQGNISPKQSSLFHPHSPRHLQPHTLSSFHPHSRLHKLHTMSSLFHPFIETLPAKHIHQVNTRPTQSPLSSTYQDTATLTQCLPFIHKNQNTISVTKYHPFIYSPRYTHPFIPSLRQHHPYMMSPFH